MLWTSGSVSCTTANQSTDNDLENTEMHTDVSGVNKVHQLDLRKMANVE
jgi:hypothetical protein